MRILGEGMGLLKDGDSCSSVRSERAELLKMT